MILEAAIVNLTRNLDLIIQENGQSISSRVKLKEEALECLASLIEKAPTSEYKNLVESNSYEMLLGYLINILCQLAKTDKSKNVRKDSLNVILSLVGRLENLHDINYSENKCSINLVYSALPGVSSTLFKLIMSDTKLPKKLLVISVKTLTKFITLAFYPCEHKRKLLVETLEDTCDNFAIRFAFLTNYVMSNTNYLAREVKSELLNLCEAIVHRTKPELLNRTLKTIVKYIAFMSSCPHDYLTEVQLKIMIIVDSIKYKIQNCESDNDGLESLVISSLFDILDNMENYCLTMLPTERESELAILCGFLKLLPQKSLTTFLEIPDRTDQLIKILAQLVEFSTQQPFLFLTDVQVGSAALETCNERIYTVEKRFAHLNEKEVDLVRICCLVIGSNCEWLIIDDILRNVLRQFSSANNLYLTNLMLKGCLNRSDTHPQPTRFSMQMISYYIDQTQDEYTSLGKIKRSREAVSSLDILKIVLRIETLVTLVELHVKTKESDSIKIIVLKSLLYPMMNWASSQNRAISEAALSALNGISHLYKKDSIKSLIEANIDYIVDGVVQTMENFVINSEVTNVLAITFKLSSIESFYYFRDVYERVFRLLRTYHHTGKSKSVALLFYRTVSILSDWKKVDNVGISSEAPLQDHAGVMSIIRDIDIDRRLKKLHHDIVETEKLRNHIRKMENLNEDTESVIKDVKSGKTADEHIRENDQDEPERKKTVHIELTEKILTHCVGLISSNCDETKILALKTAAHGFAIVQGDEDTLLPLVHQLWGPLVKRLTNDYMQNLEINLCAFECLVSMAFYAKDFIKSRTLDSVIPRLCLFLESQVHQSKGKKEYGPYCTTIAYKCQLKILTHLGALAYHIQLAYSNLWRVIETALMYLDLDQVAPLREAARTSLLFMISLDADCVWYYAKQKELLNELPFSLVYELNVDRIENNE